MSAGHYHEPCEACIERAKLVCDLEAENAALRASLERVAAYVVKYWGADLKELRSLYEVMDRSAAIDAAREGGE